MTAPLMGPCETSRSVAAPHEQRLGGAPAVALRRPQPLPASVRPQLPGLRVVRQERLEDRLQLVPCLRVLDRHDDLDAVVEVAGHQVGAAEQVRLAVAGLEAEEAAVLEEAAEDGPDAGVVG